MAQNVVNIWNDEAANFNFDTTAGATAATTFSNVYNGLDFTADFKAILTAIDKIARPNAKQPLPWGGNDLLLHKLENYPDNPQQDP